MFRSITARLIVLAFAAIAAAPAAMAKRVGLVIGIDSYHNVPSLKKATSDARAVAAVFSRIGVETVLAENVARRDMAFKLSQFYGTLQKGDEAFFFFAGHGVAIGAENYLVAADMPVLSSADASVVASEAFAVDKIIREVQQRGAASTLLVLDACRDNPFLTSGTRNLGVARGLARIDPPSGVFVLFSAGIGQMALDRLSDGDPDPNSIFTRKLLPWIEQRGLTHVALAKQVQNDVSALAATVKHQQNPAYYDQIIGFWVLVPDGKAVAANAAGPTPKSAPQDGGSANAGKPNARGHESSAIPAASLNHPLVTVSKRALDFSKCAEVHERSLAPGVRFLADTVFQNDGAPRLVSNQNSEILIYPGGADLSCTDRTQWRRISNVLPGDGTSVVTFATNCTISEKDKGKTFELIYKTVVADIGSDGTQSYSLVYFTPDDLRSQTVSGAIPVEKLSAKKFRPLTYSCIRYTVEP